MVGFTWDCIHKPLFLAKCCSELQSSYTLYAKLGTMSQKHDLRCIVQADLDSFLPFGSLSLSLSKNLPKMHGCATRGGSRKNEFDKV